MATASPTKAQAGAASKARETAVEVPGVSRREFLYYIWGASIALLLGQGVAGLIWFALPRFKEGEFGGKFPIAAGDVPLLETAPLSIAAGRFHISNTNQGLVALYGVCTHLGCLPKWDTGTVRFNCPCHGSQYELDGRFITGPAPRGLDRFVLTVTFSDGTVVDNAADGMPIPIAGKTITAISVDTGSKVLGPPHGFTYES